MISILSFSDYVSYDVYLTYNRDIFTPLYLGATIHIPNAEDIATPGRLAQWMKNNGITVTHLTPAMGQLLSEILVDNLTVDTLRVALFVGDKLTKR